MFQVHSFGKAKAILITDKKNKQITSEISWLRFWLFEIYDEIN